MDNFTAPVHPTTTQAEDDFNLDFIPWVVGPLGCLGIVCNVLIIITIARLEGKTSASGLAIQLLAVYDILALFNDALLEMVIGVMLGLYYFSIVSNVA